MRKTKILNYPAPHIHGGGVCQFMLNNLKYIDKSRFHIDYATLSKERLEISDDMKRFGCKVSYISCYPEENQAQFISEFETIFDEGYDAVHLHTSYWKGFLIEEIAIKKGVPVILVHAHNTMIDIVDDEKRTRAEELHERLKSSFDTSLATHFCACSKAAADWLYGEQIPRERIIILNNAIDIDKFSYKPSVRDKYRKELRVNDSFVIGFVGRLCYQKNPDMLIDIFNEVSKAVPEAKLLVVGTGEMLEDIIGKVDKMGLTEKVVFLGYRTDISELLQAMDVFVLPSRFEGFPITLIEAQCAGLPCVASSFITGEVKLTCNAQLLTCDISIWVDRIIAIAGKSSTRRDMSDEIAKAGFSIKEQVKHMEQIYSNRIVGEYYPV